MRRGTVVVAVVALLLPACAKGRTHAPDAPEAALRRISEAWTAAAAARDAEAMATFFAEDAFGMSPQPAPTIGRAAHRQAWLAFFALPNAEHPFTTDTVVVAASGDLGYTRGRAAGGYDLPSGRVRWGGRYIAVWRRIDGEWKILAISAHRHEPAPSMEPAAR